MFASITYRVQKIPKLESGQEVIAEVDGKQFTANDLYESLKSQYGSNSLINLIDNYITEQEITDDIKSEAKEKAESEYNSYYAYYSSNWSNFLSYYGYSNDNDLLTGLTKNYQQSLVLKKYLSTTFTDDEVKDYYDNNIYGAITARHILIIPDTNDNMTDDEKAKAKETAKEKAESIIEKLKSSTNLEEDFSNSAKENSDDTATASEGGLIENFTNESGLVKEFWNASLALNVGEMSQEPVESEYGYHIIYKVSQEDKPSLDNVKDKVISALVTQKMNEENANYVYWVAFKRKIWYQNL